MGYCNWKNTNELTKRYHDEEWGTPVFDDRIQFEYLSLEAMQCGLSFSTVLMRRDVLHQCFADFDYEKVAFFNEKDVQRIMNTPKMIHALKKIEAIIQNAHSFLKVREEYGSFSSYLWSFSDNKMILYDGHETGFIPASNHLSRKISQDLKERGFQFVGPIVIYSHLQACGIINDHDELCPRRKELIEKYPTVHKKRYGEKELIQF